MVPTNMVSSALYRTATHEPLLPPCATCTRIKYVFANSDKVGWFDGKRSASVCFERRPYYASFPMTGCRERVMFRNRVSTDLFAHFQGQTFRRWSPSLYATTVRTVSCLETCSRPLAITLTSFDAAVTHVTHFAAVSQLLTPTSTYTCACTCICNTEK